MTDRRELEPGESFGDFVIVERIAGGGASTVYRARQSRPARDVALKVLRADVATSTSRARFRLEAEILGALAHDGIAKIHEAGVVSTDGETAPIELPYIAMELIDGVPLHEWAKRENPSPRRCVEVLLDIAAAITHAHRRGVIHRDLKPSNILVTQAGAARVIDFGIARARHDDLHLTTLDTTPGAVLGTVGYMSPEQLGGSDRVIDTRTDVHALGVILFELLTGRPLHDLERLDLFTAMARVRDASPPRLGSLDAQLEGDLEVITAKALAADPDERYASAAAFADDLRRHLADEEIAARPPRLGERTRRFLRRHKIAVASALVVILLSTTAAVRITRELSRANARLGQRLERQRLHRRVVDFYHDAFAEIDSETGFAPRSFLQFLDFLGRRLETSNFEDDPLAEARIRSALGQAYIRSERRPEAEVHLARSQELESEVSGEASITYADVVRSRARCALIGASYGDARREFERAQSIYRGHDDTRARRGELYAEFGLFQVALNSHELDRALEHSGRAIDLARAGGPPLVGDLAIAIFNHADLIVEDDAMRADLVALLDEAEAAMRSYQGDRDSLMKARLHVTRAWVALNDDRPRDAEVLTRMADDVMTRVAGPDGPALYLNATVHARALANQRRYDEALDFLRLRARQQRRTDVHEHRLMMTLDYLGRLYLQVGRNEEAIDCLEEVRDTRRRLYPTGNQSTARTISTLTRAYAAATRLSDVFDSAREGLPMYESFGLHSERLHALRMLAHEAKQNGDAAGHEQKLEEIVEAGRALGRTENIEHAYALIDLAVHCAGRSDRMAEAATHFAEAVPILRRLQGRRLPANVGIRILQYADALRILGRKEEAVERLAEGAAFIMRARDSREPVFERAVKMTLQLAGLLDEPDELEDFYEAFDD